jgi:protein involved in polysaccharide export with SLBB domain
MLTQRKEGPAGMRYLQVSRRNYPTPRHIFKQAWDNGFVGWWESRRERGSLGGNASCSPVLSILRLRSTVPRGANALLMTPRSPARLGRMLSCIAIVLSAAPAIAAAQGPDSRRVHATRAELEAQLVEIDQVLSSPGYSGRLRAARRAEADLMRQRLAEGDLQVGDQITLFIVNEANLSGTFTVAAGRVLVIPGLPEIPLRGVLRSELQNHLTDRLKTYIRDPQIRVQTMIRLSLFGAVGKPGFYQVPAEAIAGDAIMAAGGPLGNADPAKTVVRRGGVEIWTREAFADALVRGLTLDQLNLRAGDELFIDTRSAKVSLGTVLPVFGAMSSLAFFFVTVF